MVLQRSGQASGALIYIAFHNEREWKQGQFRDLESMCSKDTTVVLAECEKHPTGVLWGFRSCDR